jgi:succinoglycan biosynthesis protein ExoL
MKNSKKMENKILFASSTIGAPIFSKRISMIKKAGYYVDAITFDRKEHKGRVPDCEINTLAEIEDGKYVKRFFIMLMVIKKIREKIRKTDLIYAAGGDIALIIHIANFGLKRKVIMEVSDIREIQTDDTYKGDVYRIIDKIIAKKSSAIIATAPGFINEYYKKWLNVKKKSLIIENKLDYEIKGIKFCEDYKRGEDLLLRKKIKIGYFGILRCKKTLEILHTIAETNKDNIEIVIAGTPTAIVGYMQNIKISNNLKYLGPFKSPDDLPCLYNQIDLVWACYPFPEKKSWNWRWARTNRYYECCYFKKPMIVLEESGDADDVRMYDIGKIIYNDDVRHIVKQINEITINDIIKWESNMKKLRKDIYLYTDEGDRLKKIIKELL